MNPRQIRTPIRNKGMSKEYFEGREGFAPLGPHGPAGANSSSSQNTCGAEAQPRNGIYKVLIHPLGINGAAVLSKILYWAEMGLRQSGRLVGYRSAVDLAREIGGISPSAVRDHVNRLEESGYFEIIRGEPCGDLNRPNQYKIRPGVIERANPGRGNRNAKSDFVYFGIDDANRYGIGPALLLTQLEWDVMRGVDAIGYIITNKTAVYFGVDQRQVQRWIASLKEKQVLVESEPHPPKRYLRIADGLDRRPTIVELEYVYKRQQAERLERMRQEGLLEDDPLVVAAMAPVATGLVLIHEPEVPQIDIIHTDADLRHLVSQNRASAIELNESTRDAVGEFIRSLEHETVVSFGSFGPDYALEFFMNHGIRHCPLQTLLAAELFTLSFQLRLRPWLQSSSSGLRRSAYNLALEVQGLILHARQIRSAMHRNLIESANAGDGQNAEEKCRLLVNALQERNRIGIEVGVSNSYECLNPEIRKNFIDRIPHGQEAARTFFRKNPHESVDGILRLFDACGKSPPPPEDRSSPDPWRHRRTGTKFDAFFRNFTKIVDEQ